MTPEELKTLLRRIANNIHHIQDSLYDEPLHAARYSQTDARKTNSTPAAPTDLTALDYLTTTIDPIIKGWCYNLANTHQCLGLPHDQPTTIWVAWLTRHAKVLLTTDYAQDCIDELTALNSELRHRIHPQDPHEIKLPDYATVEEIAQALGKTPAAIRKWCERKQITKYTQNGKTHYKTHEITTQIKS